MMRCLGLSLVFLGLAVSASATARETSPRIAKPVFLDRDDISTGRGGRPVYALDRDFSYCSPSLNLVITVPKSFVTDFMSVPTMLQWVKKPHSKGFQAAIIHDWLYASGGRDARARERADYIFYEALGEYDVTETERMRLHFAVRKGGEGGYGLKSDWRFVDPDSGLDLTEPFARRMAPAFYPLSCGSFRQRIDENFDFLVGVRTKPT